MTFYMIQHNMTKLMLPLSLQNGKSALMLASENGHTNDHIAEYIPHSILISMYYNIINSS